MCTLRHSRRIRLFWLVALVVLLGCGLSPALTSAAEPSLEPLVQLTPLVPPMNITMIVWPSEKVVCLGKSYQINVDVWAVLKTSQTDWSLIHLPPGAEVKMLRLGVWETHPVLEDGSVQPFNLKGHKVGRETLVFKVTLPPNWEKAYVPPPDRKVDIRTDACGQHVKVSYQESVLLVNHSDALAVSLEGTLKADEDGKLSGTLHGTFNGWLRSTIPKYSYTITPDLAGTFDVPAQGTVGEDEVALQLESPTVDWPVFTVTFTEPGRTSTSGPLSPWHSFTPIAKLQLESLTFPAEGGTIARSLPKGIWGGLGTLYANEVIVDTPEEATS